MKFLKKCCIIEKIIAMFHVKHYKNKMFHTCFLQDFVFIKKQKYNSLKSP